MDILDIIRARQLSPKLLVECMGNCTRKFALENGLAMPCITNANGDMQMLFFCSATCYLSLIPSEFCYGGRQ